MDTSILDPAIKMRLQSALNQLYAEAPLSVTELIDAALPDEIVAYAKYCRDHHPTWLAPFRGEALTLAIPVFVMPEPSVGYLFERDFDPVPDRMLQLTIAVPDGYLPALRVKTFGAWETVPRITPDSEAYWKLARWAADIVANLHASRHTHLVIGQLLAGCESPAQALRVEPRLREFLPNEMGSRRWPDRLEYSLRANGVELDRFRYILTRAIDWLGRQPAGAVSEAKMIANERLLHHVSSRLDTHRWKQQALKRLNPGG